MTDSNKNSELDNFTATKEKQIINKKTEKTLTKNQMTLTLTK